MKQKPLHSELNDESSCTQKLTLQRLKAIINFTHANITVSMVLARWQRTFNHYQTCFMLFGPSLTKLN